MAHTGKDLLTIMENGRIAGSLHTHCSGANKEIVLRLRENFSSRLLPETKESRERRFSHVKYAISTLLAEQGYRVIRLDRKHYHKIGGEIP